MQRPTLLPLLFVAILAAPAAGQRPSVHGNDIWFSFSAEQHIVGRWVGSIGLEERRSSWADVPRIAAASLTAGASLGHGRRIGFGTAWYHTSPNDDFGPARPQNEFRIFPQVNVSHSLIGGYWSHRVRWEARWLASDPAVGVDRDWTYTSRFRHQMRMQRALDGRTNTASRFYVAPSFEYFIRTTDHTGLLIDQTRAGLTFGYGVAPRLNLEVGYNRQTSIRTDQVRDAHDVIQLAARVLGQPRR